MAKRTNLLLTVLLAVICLTALLFALALPATPANAADAYTYEKQPNLGNSANMNEQVVIVAEKGSTYYAIVADSSSTAKLEKVTVQDNSITSTVTDDMLWTVEKGTYSSHFSYKNVAKGKYLGQSTTGSYSSQKLSLSDTMMSFYGGNQLNGYTNDQYLYVNTSYETLAYGAETYAIEWSAYKKTLALENPTVITFDKGHTDTSGAYGSMASVTLEQGSEYTLPSCSFTRSKYLFNGWSVNGETKQVGDTITVNADTTVTALWADNFWTVTFQMEGQEDHLETVKKGESQNLRTNEYWWSGSTPSGQLFSHWTLNGEKLTGTSYTPTEDITVVAVFANPVTISFDFDGGVAPTSSYTTFKTTTVVEGTEFSLRTHEYTASYAPTKEGHVLLGWVNVETNQEYTADLSNQYQQTEKVIINKDTTFKALWRFDGKVINFVVDGEPYATAKIPSSVASGSSYVYFSSYGVTTPKKDGYEFDTWVKQGTSTTYSSSISASAIVDGMTLEARFKKVRFIHFRQEDATEDFATSTTTASSSTYLSSTSWQGTAPAGKVFAYWVANVADSKGNTQFKSGDSYYYNFDYEGDVILTPVYGDPVTVTFDFAGHGHAADGVTDFEPSSAAPFNKVYAYGNYNKTNIIADEGFQFAGWIWKDAPDGKEGPYGLTYATNNVVIEDKDVVFVAQWKYDGYVLTFKAEGQADQEVLVPTTTANETENTTYKISIANPAKENANFLGWALNGDTSKLFKNGDTLTTAQLQATNGVGEFVAQFKDKEMVTVTFHFGNETKEVKVEKVTSGTNYQTKHISEYFPDWTDSGFNSFNGWATNPELTGTLVAIGAWRGSAEDTHYYAVVEKTFKVTFVYGNGIANAERNGKSSAPVSVPYESTTTEGGQQVDIREGYTLLGWATEEGGQVVYAAERNVTVDHECTLYAVWRYDYKPVIIEVVNGNNKTTINSEVFMRNKTQVQLADVLNELSDEQLALFAASEHRTVKWINLADGREILSSDKVAYPTGKDEETGEDKVLTLRVTVTDKLYKITFDRTGDTKIDPIELPFGASLEGKKPADPVWAGYTFNKWSNGGKDFEWTTMPGQNVTLTGVWTAQQSTLKFDLNGGKTAGGAATIADITQLSGSPFDKVADPVKEGYDFIGWTLNGADWRWTKHDTEDTYYGTMPGGTNTLVAVWELNSEKRAELKEQLTAAMTAHAREKGVEVPANKMDLPGTDTEAKIRAIYAEVIEIIDYKAALVEELTEYAEEFNITLTATDTLELRSADTKAQADAELVAAKALIDIKALANAKAAAKAAVAAAATAGGVSAPEGVEADIDGATTIAKVNEIKTAALDEIAEAVAAKQAAEAAAALAKAKTDAKAELAAYATQKKVTAPASLAAAIDSAATTDAVAAALAAGKAEIDRLATPVTPEPDAKVTAAKQAIAAAVSASGVKDALNKIAAANSAIAELTEAQKAELDLTAFNAKVADVNAKVNGAKADLAGARKVADGLVLSAVATVAMLTVAAWIAKRRTF